jgi:hypothetical protein
MKRYLPFLLVLCALPAFAAISVVKTCNHNVTTSTTSTTINIGATGTCSPAANPVAGNLEFVWLPSTGGLGPTAVDTLGNTWVCVRDATTTNSYCTSTLATGGSADTVTITTPSNSVGSVISLEFSGQNATPLDGAATFAALTTSTSWTLASVTTTAANDAVIGCGGNISVNNTFTAGSGFTIPTDGQVSGGNQSGFCEYQLVTTATAYTPTATLATTMTGITTTVAFKPATGGAIVNPPHASIF